jgi:hypothetical protein
MFKKKLRTIDGENWLLATIFDGSEIPFAGSK